MAYDSEYLFKFKDEECLVKCSLITLCNRDEMEEIESISQGYVDYKKRLTPVEAFNRYTEFQKDNENYLIKKNEMNKDIIEFEKYLLQVDLEWVEQREIEWESGF